MAFFVKIEMTNKDEYPKPVPINLDRIISFTPHLSDERRFLMLTIDGAEYDVTISKGGMRRIIALDATAFDDE